MFAHPLYQSSPVWLQERLLGARSLARSWLRDGRTLQRVLDELSVTQWLDADALQAWQLQRLRAVLRHAARHVPFYRERFKAAGFEPGDLHTLADISRLPLIERAELVDAGDAVLARPRGAMRFKASSSGTSGMILHAWRDLDSIVRERGFQMRQLHWAGVASGSRRVWLRGDRVVPMAQRSPPFWRHDRAARQLCLSSYHLSDAHADAYLAAMLAFDPVVVHAYPSPLLMLARHLRDAGRRFRGPALRAIITSSEQLGEHDAALLAATFGCPVYDWYGNAERVAAIGTCEHGRRHLLGDYSYCELLPRDDGRFDLVGSAFDNLTMPLLRYRTGDVVMPARGSSCPCGRSFRLIDRVDGRAEDHVLTPDGRRLFMVSAVFDAIPGLVEGQIRQDAPDRLCLLLVLSPLGVLDPDAVRTVVRGWVGAAMQVEVRAVARIERSPGGKLRQVVRSFGPR